MMRRAIVKNNQVIYEKIPQSEIDQQQRDWLSEGASHKTHQIEAEAAQRFSVIDSKRIRPLSENGPGDAERLATLNARAAHVRAHRGALLAALAAVPVPAADAPRTDVEAAVAALDAIDPTGGWDLPTPPPEE